MTAASETPRLDQLAVLDEQVTTAITRGRDLAAQAAEHAASMEQIKAERVEAYSTGDEAKATRLKKKAAAAEAKSIELAERREGADIATRKAQAERDRFIVENHAGIVDERRPVANEAAEAIEDAVAALTEGIKAWHREEQVQAHLLRAVPGRDGREVPVLHIDLLVRDLRRAVGPGVPLPLPRLAKASPPAPTPDPDAAPIVRTMT